MTIVDSGQQKETTMGDEQEAVVADERTGDYSGELGYNNEATTTTAEDQSDIVTNADDLEKENIALARRMNRDAVNKGLLIVPISVPGQRPATETEINTGNDHVVKTRNDMEEITGFPWTEALRMNGVQFHTRISNTKAALQAAEAMQILNPILTAPSLCGPFLEGDFADRLRVMEQFSNKQRAHLVRVGLWNGNDPDGLSFAKWDGLLRGSVQFQSWRYLMRRIVSPWAGIWEDPAPNSVDEYIYFAHEKLASGEIATIDRFFGPHADRFRPVVDNTDSTTFESLTYDTFAGNQQLITDHHILHSADFTALERMAMEGKDVVSWVAKAVGIAQLDRTERLFRAHEQMIAVSRMGTDAIVYDGNPHYYLDYLIFPLVQDSPLFNQMTPERDKRIHQSFTPQYFTLQALKQWCKTNDSPPNIRAYYDLGVGAPSYYLVAQYNSLPSDMDPVEKVRYIEHDMGLAYRKKYEQVA